MFQLVSKPKVSHMVFWQCKLLHNTFN